MPTQPSPDLFPAITLAETEPSLLDIADHVLNTGVVVQGSIVISLAGVDLVYLGLSAVLTSVETALKHVAAPKDNNG
jgi:gas vesicle structural protein